MDANAKIKALHISLYLALFRLWNRNRFINPITITRQEIMQMSKIGSPNTYSKALRELELYGFIRYHPSFDPKQGSKVDLYTFDTATCTPPVSKVIPSYKHTNNTLYKEEEENQNPELKNDTYMTQAKSKFSPPPLDHIIIYFQQKGFEETEAQRFFNYYESNGWMVGGRSKMKDWKAAARNWMLNIPKFQSTPNKAKSTNKKTHNKPVSQEKSFKGNNYNEPL